MRPVATGPQKGPSVGRSISVTVKKGPSSPRRLAVDGVEDRRIVVVGLVAASMLATYAILKTC
jgi:hypothetical protein